MAAPGENRLQAFWAKAATLNVFAPITLLSLFSRTGNGTFHLAHLWGWIVCRAAGVGIRPRWLTSIDHRRSYILIANHQFHFDGPALALGLRGLQSWWIGNRGLLKIPLFGQCLPPRATSSSTAVTRSGPL